LDADTRPNAGTLKKIERFSVRKKPQVPGDLEFDY